MQSRHNKTNIPHFALCQKIACLYIVIPVENGRFIAGSIKGGKYIDKFSSFFQMSLEDSPSNSFGLALWLGALLLATAPWGNVLKLSAKKQGKL